VPAESCPAPGAGSDHPFAVAGTETWTAANSPHRVANGLSVAGTLTIEPCATVLVDGQISVSGLLIAEGVSDRPIVFDALDAQKKWSGILIEQDSGGFARFAYAAIRNAGLEANPNVLGAIDARGKSDAPLLPRLKVDHVTISGAGKYGVVVRDGALFSADSQALTITGGASFPILADATLAGSVPAGTYTGNATDQILLDCDRQIIADLTLRDRGVPYRLGDGAQAGNDLVVGVSGPTPVRAVLTVEAGVTIRAHAAGRIRMAKDAAGPNAVGALVVAGTAAKRVIFSSAAATPAAGDWRGLVFEAPDATNAITYARVEFAGGASAANGFHCEANGAFGEDEDAAIALYGEPSSSFITNTEIVSSAGDGIGRAWSGAPTDFLATNTFTSVAECNQSFPRDANGACPANSPCR